MKKPDGRAVAGFLGLSILLGLSGYAIQNPYYPSLAVAEESSPQESQGEVTERGLELRKGSPAPTAPTSPTIASPTQRMPTPTTPSPAPAPYTGGSTGPSAVVGGITEPDYQYPWVVKLQHCGGVLIDPQWVLTAAHCVEAESLPEVTYFRTDPYNGPVTTQKRRSAINGGGRKGVFLHPMYNSPSQYSNDIALVKLEKPFDVTPYLQTVALPRTSRQAGVVGTVASYVLHTGSLKPGHVAILRGPIPASSYAPKFLIPANIASLCPGDSGSGFVTIENGRATVRGIASQADTGNCTTPNGEALFTDVFTAHDWILQTMGKSDASLSGNTRVRRLGTTARGVMGIGCPNPYGTIWGPLNVTGVEEGLVCEGGDQTIMCSLDNNQRNVTGPAPVIVGFTMRTTMPNGPAEFRALPFSSKIAAYNGSLPKGASREFTCQIGNPIAPVTQENTPVMLRGVETDQPAESMPTSSNPSEPSNPTKPE